MHGRHIPGFLHKFVPKYSFDVEAGLGVGKTFEGQGAGRGNDAISHIGDTKGSKGAV